MLRIRGGSGTEDNYSHFTQPKCELQQVLQPSPIHNAVLLTPTLLGPAWLYSTYSNFPIRPLTDFGIYLMASIFANPSKVVLKISLSESINVKTEL